MKKLVHLFTILLIVSAFAEETKAQCTSYFQASYNSATGDIDFTTLCTYDTTITPILYQWDFGDGSIVYGNNPSHHYMAANGYLVCLILYVGNGLSCCQDTFCEMIDFVPASVVKNPEWISNVAITAYGKNISLFLNLIKDQQLQMSLVTMTGLTIPIHVSSSFKQGRNEIDLALPDYPAGIYLVRIEDAKGEGNLKEIPVVLNTNWYAWTENLYQINTPPSSFPADQP
jgi:hypothetical protein